MKRTLLLFVIIPSFLNFSFGQCVNDFSLGLDTSICGNESVMLTVNNSYDSYLWQDNSTANSFLASDSGVYYVTTTEISISNLIINGDFEQGNAFFTTDYTYYPTASVFGPQASYGITSNPNVWFNPFAACPDHTTGTGLMMVADGSAFNGGTDAIWCQTLPIQLGKSYELSYWIQSVTGSNALANIEVQINGFAVSSDFAPFGACIWEKRSVIWTSTAIGTAEVCLYNLELAGNGNDFAIDDIFMSEICEYSDTLNLGLNQSDTSIIQEEICPGDSFFVEGSWRTLPGSYFDLIVGLICQDVIETELTFLSIDTTVFLQEICPSDSFFVGGAWQTNEGFYFDFLPGSPCADLIQTELTYLRLDTNIVSQEICALDSSFLGGAWQTNEGSYYDIVSGSTCDEVIQTNLAVNSLINANAGNDRTAFYEQIINLSAEGSSSGASYQWTSSNNLFETNFSIGIEVVNTIQTYYLEVSQNGCFGFDTLTIFGVPLGLNIIVPNAFSPNNDGVNDVFRVINSDEFEKIKMKLYNRWGELVYVEEGESPTWLGICNNEICPIGTNVFYIEAKPFGESETLILSGTVSLIR
jgi:gliding motility-associated-like protein